MDAEEGEEEEVTDITTILNELAESMSDIHPSTTDGTLRDARRAMAHAYDYLVEEKRKQREMAEHMARQAARGGRTRRTAHARSTDPETSKAAAETDMTKMENAVYDVIAGYGADGCSMDALLAAFPKSKSNSIMPRVKPLMEKGYVEDTGRVHIGESNKAQRVVRATSKVRP